jgi:hypothetical protein
LVEVEDGWRVVVDLSALDQRPGVVAFLAGATLIGGIAIGKAAVDAAHQKAVPPGASKGRKELDESIRLVGTIFGIGVSLFQLPRAWEEAKKLIETGQLPSP